MADPQHRFKFLSLLLHADGTVHLGGLVTYNYGMREMTQLVLDKESRQALYAALRKFEAS